MPVSLPVGPVYRQRPIVDTPLLYLGEYNTSGQGRRFLHAIHRQWAQVKAQSVYDERWKKRCKMMILSGYEREDIAG
jgi:hypothetical protein